MKTKITIDKSFNLKKLSFDLSEEINGVATAIVLDHNRRLKFGQDVNGRKFKSLTGSTIQSKRAKGYEKPRVPLFATGKLKDVEIVKRASRYDQEARVRPDSDRIQIGQFHQEGIRPHKIVAKNAKVLYPLYTNQGKKFGAKSVNHPGTPKREWFGVTKKVENDLMKRMIIKIERNIRRA